MHWRHHAAMLGVQAIALYALVICDWHIFDNCVYAESYKPPREGALRLWRHMHKFYLKNQKTVDSVQCLWSIFFYDK